MPAWATAPTWWANGTLASAGLLTSPHTGTCLRTYPHTCQLTNLPTLSPTHIPANLFTHRGFNTFSGYYTGAEHYFSHVRDKGYDFRRNDNVDYGARGNYSTDLFNQEAVSFQISFKLKLRS